MKTLAVRLKTARLAKGLTQGQLAKAAGVTQGTIGNLERGLRQQPRELLALAAAVGVTPEWLADGSGAPPTLLASEPIATFTAREAQQMSQSDHIVLKTIPWGELMIAPLPSKFDTVAPDDSMSPRIRQGQSVTFSTNEVPRPGDGVLVCDSSGDTYIRVYRAKRAGVWEAHADNDAFRPLENVADGLTVLAVLVGVQARWG